MSESVKPPEKDPFWWTPWAVLVGLVLYGLLGFLGKLTSKPNGPTAADVPATIAPPGPSSEAQK
jgi:hypothetical protein